MGEGFKEKQRAFLQKYRQLMDGCIVGRMQSGKWKRLDIPEINKQGLFPLLYEYLPQMNMERYDRYYGLTEEPVDDGKYDSLGTIFTYEEE